MGKVSSIFSRISLLLFALLLAGCFPGGGARVELRDDEAFETVSFPARGIDLPEGQTEYTRSEQMIFCSPDTGYMAVSRNPFGAVKRTTDGGRSWQTLKMWPHPCLFIQYSEGVLYTILELTGADGEPSGSALYRSADEGANWELLSEFERKPYFFHLFDPLHLVLRLDANPVLSQDGGRSWEEHQLPGPVMLRENWFCSGEKLYLTCFLTDTQELVLYGLNAVTGETTRTPFNWFCIVGAGRDMAVGHNSLSFYELTEQGNLHYISQFKWGARFKGAYHPIYIARCGDQVFCWSIQFPGDKRVNATLAYSDDGGTSWRLVADNVHTYELYTFENDSLFRIYSLYPDVREWTMNWIEIKK